MKLAVNIRVYTRNGGSLIGPIRGNSWRLLVSLSLRLRASVPRCRSTDMDLFESIGTFTFPIPPRDPSAVEADLDRIPKIVHLDRGWGLDDRAEADRERQS